MNDAQLTHLSVLTALNKMLADSSFNICTIDAAVTALRVIPDSRAYATLRPLHCVKWGDMPRELRDAVPALIERCLEVPSHQFQLTPMTAERAALVQSCTVRLLTREGTRP